MGAIYLIRHGQASFGGRNYDRLSKLGAEQSRVLGAALKARVPEVDTVICGALRRHQQTAEGCLAAMGLKAAWAEEAGWNEYDHEEIIERFEPRYRNKTLLKLDMAKSLQPRRAFQALFAKAVERWMSGEHDGDYRESWPAFSARVNDALQQLVRRLGRSKTALVFTSGGPITAVCADLLHVPTRDAFRLNWPLANAAVTKLIYSERGIYLSTLNEHAHFEGENFRLITYR